MSITKKYMNSNLEKIKDKFDYTDCPLCNSPKRIVIGYSSIYSFWKDETIVLDKIISIVECRECSFIYANPRPNEKWFLDFPNQYNYEMQIKFEESYKRILNIIKKQAGSGKNLLDIGCAGGKFVELALNLGFKAYGFDIKEEFIKHGRDILKLDLKAGKLAEINYTKEFFDIITLIEVLEHVNNPREIVRQARSLLKNKGKLFITVPNFELFYFLNFKFFKRKKDFYFLYPVEHISFWKSAVLIKTLKEEGFNNPKVYLIPSFYDKEKTSKFNQLKINTFDLIKKAIFYLSYKKFNFNSRLFLELEK